MNDIFDVLKSKVDVEQANWIEDVERHIFATEDDSLIIDFVKHAQEIYYLFDNDCLGMFKYKDVIYLLLPAKYNNAINEIGFNQESDINIIYGCEMLAISQDKIPLKAETTSSTIIEKILGIIPEIPNGSVTIDFVQIQNLFSDYSVVVVDNSRFEILYEEDIYRLEAFFLANNDKQYSTSFNQSMCDLLLLTGCRSVSPAVVNAYYSSVNEYSFLQLYQCLEYLFKLNNCFTISDQFKKNKKSTIDVLLSYDLKMSESENLYNVIKQNASDTSIDLFYDILESTGATDKARAASDYIYKIRCNIAHLRYNQDELLNNVDLKKLMGALSEIIKAVYRNLDQRINVLCIDKSSWKRIPLLS